MSPTVLGAIEYEDRKQVLLLCTCPYLMLQVRRISFRATYPQQYRELSNPKIKNMHCCCVCVLTWFRLGYSSIHSKSWGDWSLTGRFTFSGRWIGLWQEDSHSVGGGFVFDKKIHIQWEVDWSLTGRFTFSGRWIGLWQEDSHSVGGGEWYQGKWGAPWKVGRALRVECPGIAWTMVWGEPQILGRNPEKWGAPQIAWLMVWGAPHILGCTPWKVGCAPKGSLIQNGELPSNLFYRQPGRLAGTACLHPSTWPNMLNFAVFSIAGKVYELP